MPDQVPEEMPSDLDRDHERRLSKHVMTHSVTDRSYSPRDREWIPDRLDYSAESSLEITVSEGAND